MTRRQKIKRREAPGPRRAARLEAQEILKITLHLRTRGWR
jgi:hypothetical protein